MGEKVTRAMLTAPPLREMLPSNVNSFFIIVSQMKNTNGAYHVPTLPGIMMAAMPKVRIAAQILVGPMASQLMWVVPVNFTGLLLAETGGNKSGSLNFLVTAFCQY